MDQPQLGDQDLMRDLLRPGSHERHTKPAYGQDSGGKSRLPHGVILNFCSWPSAIHRPYCCHAFLNFLQFLQLLLMSQWHQPGLLLIHKNFI